MSSKSELKRLVALGKPGALAEQLAYRVCGDNSMITKQVIAILHEYGQEVRRRDAEKWRAVYDAANAYAAEYEIADDSGELSEWPEGEIERARACYDACNNAAAITKEPMP